MERDKEYISELYVDFAGCYLLWADTTAGMLAKLRLFRQNGFNFHANLFIEFMSLGFGDPKLMDSN